MNAATVQTSAPGAEGDMFADQAVATHEPEGAIYELHGTMAVSAHVAVKLVNHATQMRPVLCLEVKPAHGGQGRTLHAELVYPEDGREAAEAKAATLKRGVPITLHTSLKGMRTILPHVQAVERTTTPEATQ